MRWFSLITLIVAGSVAVDRAWPASDAPPIRLGVGDRADEAPPESSVSTTSEIPFAPPRLDPSYAYPLPPEATPAESARVQSVPEESAPRENRASSASATRSDGRPPTLSTLKSIENDGAEALRPIRSLDPTAPMTPDRPSTDQSRSDGVTNALATEDDSASAVRPIPSFVLPAAATSSHRIVRYEVPLTDPTWHHKFAEHGIQGRLIEVVDESEIRDQTFGERLRRFISPTARRRESEKLRLVRYEVPAEDIGFHAELTDLDGEMIELGLLRLPEVRFFQPKARVYMDLKRSNDQEFDLFSNGSILASLDVVELYFPMPLISERFAEVFGRPGRLASLGWRVGGTLGLGITTALNNGTIGNGSSPVTTLSSGVRYEFPLGRPSIDVIETGDPRLDERTRVGMEFGVQGGVSTRESLKDATDIGLYFGVLVNTPWGT